MCVHFPAYIYILYIILEKDLNLRAMRPESETSEQKENSLQKLLFPFPSLSIILCVIPLSLVHAF